VRPVRSRPLWSLLRVPAAFLLGLNVAVLAAFTLPRTVQERDLSARAARLRAQVETERRLTAEMRARTETIRANSSDTERFLGEVVSPRSRGLVPLLAEVEDAAAGVGLHIQNRRYTAGEVEEAPLVRLEITLPVLGTYRQLGSFIERVERLPRFVAIDRLRLREGRGDQGAQLDVVLVAYLAKGEGDGDGQ